MSRVSPIADSARDAFEPTPRGVVGLVDDLLGLCQVHPLRIEFRDGRCTVRRLDADAEDSLEVAIPKSVFRAVLARVAALCNEQHPRSATPYGGEGDIVVPASIPEDGVSPSKCHAKYTNTPSDQRLDLTFARNSFGDGDRVEDSDV